MDKNLIINDEFRLKAIFYTDTVLRDVTSKLVSKYLENFAVYEQQKNMRNNIFSMLEFVILWVWILVILCYYVFFFRKEVNGSLEILDLIKE